jgi:hypothetical protein
VQQLRKLHVREAHLLRQRAGRPPKPTMRISQLSLSREYVAFMDLMVGHMRELCGRPMYEAVTTITNIAYPEADVTAEAVRAACRPTTREGRLGKGT